MTLGVITQVAFKNCTPFEKCSTKIDGTLVDGANYINITMSLTIILILQEVYGDLKEMI